jgi:hypothetical protein
MRYQVLHFGSKSELKTSKTYRKMQKSFGLMEKKGIEMKTSDLYCQLFNLEAKLEEKNAQLLKLNDEIEELKAKKEEALDALAKTLGMVPAKSDNVTLCVPKRFCADRQEFRRRLHGLMQVLDSEPNVFRSSEEIISKAIHMLHLNPACHITRESLLHQLTRLGKEGYIERKRPHANAQYVYKPKALGA